MWGQRIGGESKAGRALPQPRPHARMVVVDVTEFYSTWRGRGDGPPLPSLVPPVQLLEELPRAARFAGELGVGWRSGAKGWGLGPQVHREHGDSADMMSVLRCRGPGTNCLHPPLTTARRPLPVVGSGRWRSCSANQEPAAAPRQSAQTRVTDGDADPD